MHIKPKFAISNLGFRCKMALSCANNLSKRAATFYDETQSLILDFKLSPCSELVFFLLGDSPASEFYVPMFRNTVQSSLVV